MEKIFKEIRKEQQKQTKILKSIERRLEEKEITIDGEAFVRRLETETKNSSMTELVQKPYFGITEWRIPEKDRIILDICLMDGNNYGVTNSVKRYDELIRDIHESLHNKGYVTSMTRQERAQATKRSF